jgi:hypothetical protein
MPTSRRRLPTFRVPLAAVVIAFVGSLAGGAHDGPSGRYAFG